MLPWSCENSDPVGSGPFMWAATDEESTIRLLSNSRHPLYAPMIDELVLRYVDADDLGAALLAGEVDLIAEVTTEAEAELRAATDIEVVSGAQPVIDDIIFNLADEAICPPGRGDLFRSSGAARSQRAACHGPRNRQATDHRRESKWSGHAGSYPHPR